MDYAEANNGLAIDELFELILDEIAWQNDHRIGGEVPTLYLDREAFVEIISNKQSNTDCDNPGNT
ncbi:MAG: hypothetical protein ACR2PI_24850 [Hyphomicrobiaceae bacterium]